MAIATPLLIVPPYDALPDSTRGLSSLATIRPGLNGLNIPDGVNIAAGQGYTSSNIYYCTGFDYFALLIAPGWEVDVGVNAVILDASSSTEFIEIPWGVASGASVINRIEKTMPGVAKFKLKFFGVGGEACGISKVHGLFMAKL